MEENRPLGAAGHAGSPAWKRGIGGVSTLLLGGTLILAAALKIDRPQLLAGTLQELLGGRLLSPSATLTLARCAGVAEFACGLLVFGRRWTGSCWVLVGTMLFLFLVYDLARYVGGDGPDCGCLGTVIQLSSWWQVASKHLALFMLLGGYAWTVPAGHKIPACRDPGT